MRSVGPFELTEAEFAGMEILWREDERQLKNTTLRVVCLGHRLIVKSYDPVAIPAAVELIQSMVSIDNQFHSLRRNEAGLETGESGETADVEAESEIVRRNRELPESEVRRVKRSAFEHAVTR